MKYKKIPELYSHINKYSKCQRIYNQNFSASIYHYKWHQSDYSGMSKDLMIFCIAFYAMKC